MSTKKITYEWKCPECGAPANDHGKGGNGECIQLEPGSCAGFICDCSGNTPKEHGESLTSPCPEANCYHCGWGGTFPKSPKKIQAWEKKALEAGWVPPEKRVSELGLTATEIE